MSEDEDILKKLEKEMVGEGKDFGQYTQYTQHFTNIPDNQFGHAWQLVDIRRGKVSSFDDLLNPHLFLASINDEKTLRFYQNDILWLNGLFRLSQKDKAIDYVFEPLWNSFLTELRLTGTLDGSERIYQSFKTPKTQSKGFRFFKKKSKKKEPMDYVLPDEEDEGMY